MRSTRVAVAILLAALVTVAAGCGGGSSSSTTTTHSLFKTGTSSTPVTSSSGGAEPAFASAGNCQQLAGLAAKAAAALQSSGSAANALQTESGEIQALAKAAPSDIRGDFQTFATAFSGFIDALHKSGYKLGSKTPPTAAQAAALVKAEKSFESPKLKQAETHLQAWAKQNCKGVHVSG